MRTITRDGTYRWVRVQGTPQFSEQGTFTGYAGVTLDIHDQKVQELQDQNAHALN